MFSSLVYTFIIILTVTITRAQAADDSGYFGYSLSSRGDTPSAVFDSASTPANVSTTFPAPDVFLNATVRVGEIDITVANLSAKINIDAQVLQLLKFNAGVDISVDRVALTIQKVNAHVVLEARLANLVLMIDDVLKSIDLNPVLATLGQDVSQIVNTTVGGLTGATSSLESRSVPVPYNLAHNILYSINDYSGHTHTNRVLKQNGNIADQSLDDDGNILSEKPAGTFLSEMTFNGFNHSAVIDGMTAQELEYVYTPFPGISVVSAVYIDSDGEVLATQVLSESGGGGSSTLGDL